MLKLSFNIDLSVIHSFALYFPFDFLSFTRALKSTIMRDLEKDEVEQLPFISFIGDTNEQSTLFTAATEAVKLGFIGVSIVQGGFDQVKKEIVQVGSEDLLLWREEEVVQQNTEQVNKEWNDPRGVTGWLG